MPSEQRLHPVSILFAFGGSLKAFALPGLGVMIAGRSSTGSWSGYPGSMLPANWEFWIMLLLIPAALHAVAKYLSYRVRYEDTELVIRSGIVFRNERHVPYSRIQNLEAVRNVFHRAFGVVEVRVENASGKEPEARISVLPLAAFDTMRRRVFEGRLAAAPGPAAGHERETSASPAVADAPADQETLLRLTLRDLLLCGFIENRGMVPIAAAYGFLWELGPLANFWSRVIDDESAGAGMVRETAGIIAAGRWPPLDRLALAVAGIVGLLIFVRLVSMVWAVVRLHGFRLTRAGDDLRTEFGLFTRVSATTPITRIQTITVRESPLHRRFRRVSVRVETAGGSAAGKPGGGMERAWLAPIIRKSELPALVQHLLSVQALDQVEWQPVHPRAFRRAVKPAVLVGATIAAASAQAIGWSALAVLPVSVAWFVVATLKRIQHMGWSASDDVVVFRTGWLWRVVTIARIAKIQAVSQRESPFDRRTAMARIRVDTSGAGLYRIDIPYLPRDTAHALYARLASGAAHSDFRW